MGISSKFGEYIIFADESGDSGLSSIDQENPLFILCFCIFKKTDYASVVRQAITKLKFDFWGHDQIILHNHEIRKSKGDFTFLFNEEIRRLFMHALNETIRTIPFSIIAAAIDKRQIKTNPYMLALEFCLTQSFHFAESKKQTNILTHIVIESRNHNEDRELESTFRKIAYPGYPFDIKFANKKSNSCGLQIADLVAHPIGKHILKPSQSNKAFEIIREKLVGYPEHVNFGLNVYSPENEMPQQKLRHDAGRELPAHLNVPH